MRSYRRTILSHCIGAWTGLTILLLLLLVLLELLGLWGIVLLMIGYRGRVIRSRHRGLLLAL
jgi:hypothetical protein